MRFTLLETNMDTPRGPMKTTVLLKGDYMDFHVSLGECTGFISCACAEEAMLSRGMGGSAAKMAVDLEHLRTIRMNHMSF